MRQLLFSHHSLDYIGISYSGFRIPCHWRVMPYTNIHMNMIIQTINVLQNILTINILRTIIPIPTITQLHPQNTPPVTVWAHTPPVTLVNARDCILPVTPIIARAHTRVFAITSKNLLYELFPMVNNILNIYHHHQIKPCIIKNREKIISYDQRLFFIGCDMIFHFISHKINPTLSIINLPIIAYRM